MKRRVFIGAVAKQSGMSVQTIRYYERLDLLGKPPRTDSRYRLYGEEALDRLEFIKKAQNLGLRLDEIREILNLADRGRCPCGHVQRSLKTRLGEIREKIADLRSLERRLREAIRHGCPPKFKPSGKARCPTIDRQRIPVRKRK